MELNQQAAEYARRNSGGMQPVKSVGKRLEAAYLAGATRELGDAEARILVEELYGPGEPAEWQLSNAQSALSALRAHWSRALPLGESKTP